MADVYAYASSTGSLPAAVSYVEPVLRTGKSSAADEPSSSVLYDALSAGALGLLSFSVRVRLCLALEHQDLRTVRWNVSVVLDADRWTFRPLIGWGRDGPVLRLCAVVVFVTRNAARDANRVRIGSDSQFNAFYATARSQAWVMDARFGDERCELRSVLLSTFSDSPHVSGTLPGSGIRLAKGVAD